MHILGRVISDTKKQHMCVMNTTKHVASYQSIIHPKCGWITGPNVFGHHPKFLAKNMNPAKSRQSKEMYLIRKGHLTWGGYTPL
jgi:hypothetical protein